MREARIILPHNTRLIHKTGAILKWMRGRLCEIAGGYTETTGRGGWIDDEGKTLDEEITIFDVAVEKDDMPTLRELARAMGERAEQKCVYLRAPSGEVSLVKIEEPADATRADDALVA